VRRNEYDLFEGIVTQFLFLTFAPTHLCRNEYDLFEGIVTLRTVYRRVMVSISGRNEYDLFEGIVTFLSITNAIASLRVA